MKIDTPYPMDVIKEIEKKYPVTAKAFKAIQHENFQLFSAKQLSYGPSNISMGTMLETEEDKRLALTALTIRMNDKIQRLLNLIVRNNKNTVQDESIIDTFADLGIYAVIAQIVNDDSWGK